MATAYETHRHQSTLTSHPAFMIAILGAGVAAIIALAIWAVEGGEAEYAAEETHMEGEAAVSEMSTAGGEDGTIEEMSGPAVEPEDTGDLTTPVADGTETEDVGEMSTEEAAMAEGGTEGEEGAAAADDLDTSVVVDPDAGAKGGPDPDGGAAPFNPTPSGPEGSDGDPLTTE